MPSYRAHDWKVGGLKGFRLGGGALLFLIVGLVAMPSAAQAQPHLTVVLCDNADLSAQELDELQVGIEQLVEDFGGFTLVDGAERSSLLGNQDTQRLSQCGGDAQCYEELLAPIGVDCVLGTEVLSDPEGLMVTIHAVNVQEVRVEMVQEGFLPTTADSMYILANVHEALGMLQSLSLQHRAPVQRGSTSSTNDDDWGDDDWGDDDSNDDGSGSLILPPPPRTTNTLALAMEVGGVTVMIGGIVCWILADDTLQEIQSEPHERTELTDLQSSGETYELIGNIATATGGALVITGLILDLLEIGVPQPGRPNDDDEDWVQLEFSGLASSPSLHLELVF